MDLSKVEATMNELVQLCIDAQKRYRNAADHTSIGELESFLRMQCERRQAAAVSLQGTLLHLGLQPKEKGTLKGEVERLGMDVSVAMSMGDSGLISWCRDEAQKLEQHFGKALSQDLPQTCLGVLAERGGEVHEGIKELNKILDAYGGPRS